MKYVGAEPDDVRQYDMEMILPYGEKRSHFGNHFEWRDDLDGQRHSLILIQPD